MRDDVVTVVALAEILRITPDGIAKYCRRHRIELLKVRGPDGRHRNALTVTDAERIVDRYRYFEDSLDVLDGLRRRLTGG